MTDTISPDQPLQGDEPNDVTIEVEIADDEAEREIEEAVAGRRGIARKYVRRIRRRNPDATPAEVIRLLERHYVTAISVAGAAVTAGGIAVEIGISLIPGAGGAKAVAKGAGKQAARAAGKQAVKAAGKSLALGVAKNSAQRAASLLPAGDQQLQFEITALFALSVAEIHGLELDQQQAHALVYGLSNDRVSQEQIAAMATDLAQSDAGPASVGQRIAAGRTDWSHWANTLGESLPGGSAQVLLRGVQTGVLEDLRGGLGHKQQAAVEYGLGAVVGGAARFSFGREVVDAARTAFAEAPDVFPVYLDIPPQTERSEDEPNRALEALEDAAKTVGAGFTNGAAAVGSGVANAAGAVARPFRKVDLDGDGVPDEPQALTAVKGVGSALGSRLRLKKGARRGADDAGSVTATDADATAIAD